MADCNDYLLNDSDLKVEIDQINTHNLETHALCPRIMSQIFEWAWFVKSNKTLEPIKINDGKNFNGFHQN